MMPAPANSGPTPVPAGQSTSAQSEAVQSKRDLASWWKQFKRTDKKPQENQAPAVQGIFGVPLAVSIRYANVAISLFNDEGQGYIYGYVPIVVAKCGVFLKEKATDIEGIFRLAGSEKRIKELKVAFDSPDRYGKGLDWTGYTVHDAANILRRYFNQLPEPIIPLSFYERFRDPLRNHQAQAVGMMEAQSPTIGDFDPAKVIKVYQGLITELPPLNRQLLLYILDLLAVFASKSDLNKMTTPNLAAIFQPGLLSHPQHDLAPQEYRLSQDVLIFLIENQDSFLIGMPGTAADQETVKEVQSGVPTTPQSGERSPSSPSRSRVLGRSSSNASNGTWSNLRRNVSISSRQSRQSGTGPTPVTPGSSSPNNSSGVHRSNTVPSRRAGSAAQSPRFQRDKTPDTHIRASVGAAPAAAVEPPQPTSVQQTPVAPSASTFAPSAPIEVTSASSSEVTTPLASGIVGSDASSSTTRDIQTPKKDTTPLLAPPHAATETHADRANSITPSSASGRGFLNILKQSPSSEGESRKPNKLQKKRIPGSALSSAQSSSQDLGEETVVEQPPLPIGQSAGTRVLSAGSFGEANMEAPANAGIQRNATDATIRRPKSAHSERSNTSVTDHSDADMVGDDMPAQGNDSAEKPKQRRRWRFSRSQNKLDPAHQTSPENPLGTMSARDQAASRSTIASQTRRTSNEPSNALPPPAVDHNASSGPDQAVFSDSEKERKGPMSWIRGKIQERKEKDAEKRAKTPERKAGASPEESMPIRNASSDLASHAVSNNAPPTIIEEPKSTDAATVDAEEPKLANGQVNADVEAKESAVPVVEEKTQRGNETTHAADVVKSG